MMQRQREINWTARSVGSASCSAHKLPTLLVVRAFRGRTMTFELVCPRVFLPVVEAAAGEGKRPWAIRLAPQVQLHHFLVCDFRQTT